MGTKCVRGKLLLRVRCDGGVNEFDSIIKSIDYLSICPFADFLKNLGAASLCRVVYFRAIWISTGRGISDHVLNHLATLNRYGPLLTYRVKCA